MLDLRRYARTEREDPRGVLTLLGQVLSRSGLTLEDHPDAELFALPGTAPGLPEIFLPPCAALTDEMSAVGVLATGTVLGFPTSIVPLSAQYRHDLDLAPLDWFAAVPQAKIKASTAGEKQVLGGDDREVTVKGGTGNKYFRTAAGIYGTTRATSYVETIRAMVMMPYARVDEDCKLIDDYQFQTRGLTDIRRLANAARHFLVRVHETGHLGILGTKPTQSPEDAILTGLVMVLAARGKQKVTQFQRNFYREMRVVVDKALVQMPDDFFEGLDELTGEIHCVIADTVYKDTLPNAELEQTHIILLEGDIDGDRLTDQALGVRPFMEGWIQKYLQHLSLPGSDIEDIRAVIRDMGYPEVAVDMPSVLLSPAGTIVEQTLGTAPDLLEELVREGECRYDLTTFFELFRLAAIATNPRHEAWINKRVAWGVEAMKPSMTNGLIATYEAVMGS